MSSYTLSVCVSIRKVGETCYRTSRLFGLVIETSQTMIGWRSMAIRGSHPSFSLAQPSAGFGRFGQAHECYDNARMKFGEAFGPATDRVLVGRLSSARKNVTLALA